LPAMEEACRQCPTEAGKRVDVGLSTLPYPFEGRAMKRLLFVALLGLLILSGPATNPAAVSQELTVSPKAGVPSGPSASTPAEKKYEDFNKVTQGAKEHEGLFKLYLKDDHLFAEIQSHQFDRPFLLPMAIARGLGMG